MKTNTLGKASRSSHIIISTHFLSTGMANGGMKCARLLLVAFCAARLMLLAQRRDSHVSDGHFLRFAPIPENNNDRRYQSKSFKRSAYTRRQPKRAGTYISTTPPNNTRTSTLNSHSLACWISRAMHALRFVYICYRSCGVHSHVAHEPCKRRHTRNFLTCKFIELKFRNFKPIVRKYPK